MSLHSPNAQHGTPPRSGNIVRISAEGRVYILGGVMLVALTICSRNFGDRGGPQFMASLTIAGVAYLLALRELLATPELSRRLVIICLILSAVWHVEFLRLPPAADDDIHRYVWDGRLQRLGYNPYLVVPSDPTIAALHTSETRTLNNPDLPSPYPAGAQLFFRAITAIHESVFAFKVAFVLCDFAIVFGLLDLLRCSQRPAHMVLVYAWNPLLAIEVAGSGHIDIVGALLLVISVAALARRWRRIAALTLGLAIAVKFLPIVLLPLYWKRVRIRDAALAGTLVALLYVPFGNHGRIPVGSLGTYVTGFRFNGPVFAILHHVAPPQLRAGLAVLVGLVTAIWLRNIRLPRTTNSLPAASQKTLATELSREDSTEPSPRNPACFMLQAFAWPMAASLFCAPVVFPWYLLWLLPFLMSGSTLLIAVWSVSIIPTYIMWHLHTQTGTWGALPVWVMLVEYGCVAVAGASIWLIRINARDPVLRKPRKVGQP